MDRTIFGDEHEQFRIMVRRFFTGEVLPDYPNWQDHGMPPRWFWKRAGEFGILGIGVPTERVSRIYGGSSEIMKVIAQGFDFRRAESA